ncbi:unnamed protein product [Bursaphelenchus okinawaensis]|uniref:Uncharacterized protein n=1 Tax=Bursaphelenchus okinawaensis TaxID=465554 RepID=A0A811K4U4_9BILA|nr:unnamed protein product [Bursaphelenchus okinawaensis]CAG9092513.1 unnamed protein product [Bursaphelenchus okinawaensis]
MDLQTLLSAFENNATNYKSTLQQLQRAADDVTSVYSLSSTDLGSSKSSRDVTVNQDILARYSELVVQLGAISKTEVEGFRTDIDVNCEELTLEKERLDREMYKMDALKQTLT